MQRLLLDCFCIPRQHIKPLSQKQLTPVQLAQTTIPMPDRIPMPKQACKDKMLQQGFKLTQTAGYQFIECEPPDGWTFYDVSRLTNYLVWYIVDKQEMAHVQISGRWEGPDKHRLITLWLPIPRHISELQRGENKPKLHGRQEEVAEEEKKYEGQSFDDLFIE